MGKQKEPEQEPAPSIGPPQNRHRPPCGLCSGTKQMGQPAVACDACDRTGHR